MKRKINVADWGTILISYLLLVACRNKGNVNLSVTRLALQLSSGTPGENFNYIVKFSNADF